MKHFLVRTILKLMRYFGQILEILHLKVFIPPNIAHRIANKLHIELVDDPNTLYKFWRQEKPKGNYFGTPEWSARSQTIITILSPWVKKENSILEVGCNVGRNLNHLWNAGYKNLNGIEISEIAVARGLKAYPHLSEISMHLGPAEVILPKLKADSIDVVFTMAVLEHIHPESRQVFAEIARIARKYVLAFESASGNSSHRQYPWDIEKEFLATGLSLMDRRPWPSLLAANETDPSIQTYDAILFKA